MWTNIAIFAAGMFTGAVLLVGWAALTAGRPGDNIDVELL